MIIKYENFESDEAALEAVKMLSVIGVKSAAMGTAVALYNVSEVTNEISNIMFDFGAHTSNDELTAFDVGMLAAA